MRAPSRAAGCRTTRNSIVAIYVPQTGSARRARLEPVVVDDELEREYQKFLQERNRDRSASDGRPDRSSKEIHHRAIEHDVPVVRVPDFRIGYERAAGRLEMETSR